MKFTAFLLVGFALAGLCEGLRAQRAPRITGNLQSNANFFIRDPKIGASNTPQYDYLKFGAENWLNLNYSNWGFDIGVRFDMFNNSNLLNPTDAFTGEGIGRWYVHKKIDKFEVSGGYLYDQIGAGIIFRAYEERALMIDNALFGVQAAYHFNDNWKIKGFSGRMKRQFGTYGTVIRGAALEGFVKPDSARTLTLAPGIGVTARTYDNGTVNQIVNAIATYNPLDSIGAQYNTYAFTLYNTLSTGDFTWYAEGAYKTPDVIYNPFVTAANGALGKLINESGYTVYSSLAYARSGLGITLEAKRNKNFAHRNTPFDFGVQGAINFLPPMARQNTFRLPARFSPATQELGEQGLQFDIKYALNKKISLGLNISEIQLLDGQNIYREIAPEFTFKQQRKWQLLLGLQLLRYSMPIYQGKDDKADARDILGFLGSGDQGYVEALTPYAEWLYRFTPRRSLRLEAQYLISDDEFGSWFNMGAELGFAPRWLIFGYYMYKIPNPAPKPGETADPEKNKFDGVHYPSLGAAYTFKANRLSFAYVKQVEGINCAGGICRYEPAFNGFRMNITSSF